MAKPRKWNDEQLIAAVPSCHTMRDVMKQLGLKPAGGSHTAIYRHCDRLGLDYSHFLPPHSGSRPKRVSDLLKGREGKKLTDAVKKALFRDGALKKQCSVCHLTEWMGQPIPIHIDHENGNPLDNRLENLRSLCANCHGLTETWGNKKRNFDA